MGADADGVYDFGDTDDNCCNFDKMGMVGSAEAISVVCLGGEGIYGKNEYFQEKLLTFCHRGHKIEL